ncbi:MAG: GNAT family N-acetyltransferase [Pseudomonadota bacterium]
MALPLFVLHAPGSGRVGLSPMPGRYDGLAGDLGRMAESGVTVLLSMTPRHEWAGDLEAAATANGIKLFHLPVPDWGAPPEATQALWPKAAAGAHLALDRGETVIAHCAGGRGRSGTAILRLMVERGAQPEAALAAIRQIRPGAVETSDQQDWAALPVQFSPHITADPDFEDWEGLHQLLTESFAYMDGRIDPPSSLLRLTVEGLRDKAQTETLWGAMRGARLLGCLFAQDAGDTLYLGKIAVRAEARGQGLARCLITAAEAQACDSGKRALMLQSRIELTENHAAFQALGFIEVGRTSHDGCTQPTSITFEKRI